MYFRQAVDEKYYSLLAEYLDNFSIIIKYEAQLGIHFPVIIVYIRESIMSADIVGIKADFLDLYNIVFRANGFFPYLGISGF